MFTHLHTHTEYSLLDGLSKIDPLMERAHELGQKALAITDHGALYGAIEFYQAAKKHEIKPIIGIEAYVAPGSRFERDPKMRWPYHLTLLAQNETGYRNLLKLSSASHLEGFYYRPRMDRELLEAHSEGLIALSGCPSGEFMTALRNDDDTESRAPGIAGADMRRNGCQIERDFRNQDRISAAADARWRPWLDASAIVLPQAAPVQALPGFAQGDCSVQDVAAQLAALMDGQRRLLHDVSHELRSPLARLQAAVGLARQQPENTESSFDRIEREAERMNDLVGELLTLSRLEAGVQGPPPEAFDITELTAAVVEDARFEASAQGRQVAYTAEGPAIVNGQAELLHRAVENIVRNALRHTPEHSTIEVEVVREAQRVRITVRDAGPGVPAARVGEIFEPFVRMPGARSDGHGLGLAIARRVVESAGGSISARNRAEGGLAVEIVLPLAGDDTPLA